jgi:hypothetical protein
VVGCWLVVGWSLVVSRRAFPVFVRRLWSSVHGRSSRSLQTTQSSATVCGLGLRSCNVSATVPSENRVRCYVNVISAEQTLIINATSTTAIV